MKNFREKVDIGLSFFPAVCNLLHGIGLGSVPLGADQFIQIYRSLYFHIFQYFDTFVKSLETKIQFSMKPTRKDADNVKRLYFAELGLHCNTLH